MGLEVCLAKNRAIEITGVPDETMCEVTSRYAARQPRRKVNITSAYPSSEPVLYAKAPGYLTLTLQNRTGEYISGTLRCVSGNLVTPSECDLALPAIDQRQIELCVMRDNSSKLSGK